MLVLPGVFGCVTSFVAMLLGISDLTGISPRINLKSKAFRNFNIEMNFTKTLQTLEK